MKISGGLSCCLVLIASVQAIPTSVLANSKSLSDALKVKFLAAPNDGSAAVVASASITQPTFGSGHQQQQQQQQQQQLPASGVSDGAASAPAYTPPSPPPPPTSQQGGAPAKLTTADVHRRAAPQKRGAVVNPSDYYKDSAALNAAAVAAAARNGQWYPNAGSWNAPADYASADRRLPAASYYQQAAVNDQNDEDDEDEFNAELGASPYDLPYAYRAAAAAAASRPAQSTAQTTASSYDNLQRMLNADVLGGAQDSRAYMMAADPEQYNPYYYYDGAVERRRRRKRRSTGSNRIDNDNTLSPDEFLQILALTEAAQQMQHPTPISQGLSPYTEEMLMLINPKQFQRQQQQYGGGRLSQEQQRAALRAYEGAIPDAGYEPRPIDGYWHDGPVEIESYFQTAGIGPNVSPFDFRTPPVNRQSHNGRPIGYSANAY